MKKAFILCLALCLCVSSALAESTIYKSDLFFLYLGDGWTLYDSEKLMYQNRDQFIVIKETPYNTGGKGLVALLGKLAYEATIIELFNQLEYVSSEVTEIDGHIIPIIISPHVNFEWYVTSFVLGDNALMIVGYVDRAKPGYTVLKDRMVEIMLNASAR